MHRHLKAGAVEAPNINKVIGGAREQVAGAILLARLIVKEQEPVIEILAHAIGDAGGNIAGQHAQQIAQYGHNHRERN